MEDEKDGAIDCLEAFKTLTPRQIEILLYIAGNQTSKQIASELNIAPSTVKTHRRNICKKLGLSGPNALMHWAIENKSQLL